MGTLNLREKDRVAARREFDRALALDPNSFNAISGLVAVDIDEKNVARARATVDARVEKAPRDAATLALAAATYAALHETGRQEEMLRRLIEVEPANLQAFAGLASLYAQENRLDEARAGFEALVLRAPKSVGVQTMIAVILQAQHKDAEAQQAYERVLKMDPGAGLAANNLAWIRGWWRRAGRPDLTDRQTPDAGCASANDTLEGPLQEEPRRQAIPLSSRAFRTVQGTTYRPSRSARQSRSRSRPGSVDEAPRQKPTFARPPIQSAFFEADGAR